MSVRPTVGASAEVIAHHVAQHGSCGTTLADCLEVRCACGTTIALGCPVCKELLFIIVRPGTWCWHAEAAWREFCE